MREAGGREIHAGGETGNRLPSTSHVSTVENSRLPIWQFQGCQPQVWGKMWGTGKMAAIYRHALDGHPLRQISLNLLRFFSILGYV
ncbi:hypothetical protein, partial [Sandarakinorhabdus sp.]|uniref:hypothetical protein n=1 Tax=Sandarakinorhabdus sp. TaxID=1916663 RepID=UPI003341DE69